MTEQITQRTRLDHRRFTLVLSLTGSLLMTALTAQAAETSDPVAARNALISGQSPRIAPLAPEQFTPEQQAVFEANAGIAPTAASASGSNTLLVEMVGILARAPAVYAPHMDSARAFFFQSSLTPRDRELVILRTAWLSQSPYEWGEHVRIGKDSGITADEIERATHGSEAEGWSDHDRALVRSVEELHFDSYLSDETWEQLSKTYTEEQRIELIMLIGQYKTVAYYLNSLRIKLRDGSQGLLAR